MSSDQYEGYKPLTLTTVASRPEEDVARRCSSKDSLGEDAEKVDIVQFTSALYFVEEHEGSLIIDVMRMGGLRGPASVQWETVDASATAEEDYFSNKGLVEFEEGQHNKEIKVQLKKNDIFKTTLEFKVVLQKPSNSHLGAYLHTCRVKIIDESAFPSDVFKQSLDEGDGLKEDLITTVKRWDHYTVFMEFIKLVAVAGSLRSKTFIIVLFDQMKNFYHLLSVYLSMYMVNTVLNTHDPEAEKRLLMPTRTGELYLVTFCFLFPMLVLHIWDYVKLSLDLEGSVVTFLRVNLFRKYLNYSAESRSKVDSGSVALSLEHDVELLAAGYVGLCELLTNVGKLGVSFYFTSREAHECLWIVMVLPVVTFLWSAVRVGMMLKLDGAAKAKMRMLSFIHDTAVNYELIDSYGVRPTMVEVFEDKAAKVVTKKLVQTLFELNTQYFVRWLTPVMFCVYMCKEAGSVIQGQVSLGQYLAIVKIIYEVGESCFVAYEHWTGVVHTFKPLQRIVVLFNRPTDLPQRKAANRKRRDDSHKARHKALRSASAHHADVVVKSDLMPIKLKGVSFDGAEGTVRVLHDVSVSVDQGNIIALIGPHRSGKNTLLKLLCMKTFPSEGTIFVPMHLRVLFVSQEPYILSLSAYQNLIIGLPPGKAPDNKRIERILQTLGMVETLEMVRDDLALPPTAEIKHDTLEPHEQGWKSSMSATGLSLFKLACAFISNPEVMVMQKPLAHYDDEYEILVLRAFRDHVDNRGLCMPSLQGKKHLRRPRTLFYSTMERRHAKFADTIWHFSLADAGNHHQINTKDPDKWSPFTPTRSTVTVSRMFNGSSVPIFTSTYD